jgi:integrase
MPLSDTAVRNAKPSEKPRKLADERGMYLLIQPNGSKLWRFDYRFDGKRKTLALGSYPDVPLVDARERRDIARKMIASVPPVDPAENKKAEKVEKEEQSKQTFEVWANRWWKHWQSGKSPRHAGYVQRRLEADVFPSIGHLPITSINAHDVVDTIKGIAERGALDMAARAHQTIGQIFRYTIAHGKESKVTHNPATDIKPSDIIAARKQVNYARVDVKELPALLRAIEASQTNTITRLAIKLMALTFVRTGELIGARWDEIDFDAAQWRIPAERMKMKTPHIVPLSSQAVEVLQTLHIVTGNGGYLFPSQTKTDATMSNNTILVALGRMGYKGRMTGHGFRGLASTILHEHGFDHQHIELQLAHAERNEVSAAYNHALYLKQRAEMMQQSSPTCSASCSCVSPACFRSTLIRAPISFLVSAIPRLL